MEWTLKWHKIMKKIDVLVWGIRHIAGNHHKSSVVYTDYETGSMILCSGTNVPTTADVHMLAEDVGVSGYCSVKGFAVEMVLPKQWVDTVGQEEFVPAIGMMMWKRTAIELGGHLGYMAEEYDPYYERSGSFYVHIDDLQAAKDACISECRRTRNGNLYSVWEVGMKDNTEVFCCQYSNISGEVVDITEQELARYEETKKQLAV